MDTVDTSSIARQQWLESAMDACGGLIEAQGRTVPEAVRISCGFPKGSHGAGKAIGQCWAIEASADKHNEIFISPELGNSVQIFGVIAHELVHATVGVKAGHKRPFRDLALAIGLEGKMTATTESAEFKSWASDIIQRIGKYPAGPMSSMMRKKQTTRLLKCSCEDCGYTVRVTRKWVEDKGTPLCPDNMESMKCEEIEGEDSE